MKQLLNYLKPLKNKIHLQYFISTVSVAFTLAVSIDAVLVLFSKIVFIYGVFDIALAIIVATIAIGLVIWQFLRPTDYKTARIADSLGFKERFVTALELLNKDGQTELEKLAIDDALNCAKRASFKELYKIKLPKYMIIAPAAALLLFAIAYFIPIEPSEKLQQQQEMHELLDNAVEDMKKDVDTSNLTAKQKKELNKELNTLKKQLAAAENKTEAVNEIMKEQTQLKKIQKNSQNEQIKAIGNKLAQNQSTQGLGELLKNGNIEEFNEELKAINDNLKNMSQEQINEFGKALKQAAQDNSIDEATKQLLDDLADTMQGELSQEKLGEISQGLSELSDQIDKLANENKDIRDAIEKLNNDLADASGDLGGNADKNGQNGTQNGGNTAGGKGGKGDGNSAQTGSGNGENSLQASNGNAANSDGENSGRGRGTIPNANVYTSNATNYKDYDAELKDNANDGTGKTINNKVDGANGEIVPYTDVIEQYRNEAMNNMEQEDIPYGVKEIVRDYFSSLE